MMVRNLTLALLFTSAYVGLQAQSAAGYRSLSPAADQWELGVDLGTPTISSGEIDAKFPGIGAGLHVRKAFGHAFSFRASALYASMKNENERPDLRSSESSWISGSGQAVVTLNNLLFRKPNSKIGVNLYAGLGITKFTTDAKSVVFATDPSTAKDGSVEGTNAFFESGLGIAYRVNSKFNIGLEYSFINTLGADADLLDGDEAVTAAGSSYNGRDVVRWPHLSLNFNLGKDKSEPLYWVNPLGATGEAIAALEARPVYDPTDTDGDGIIDAIDKETNSPAGARVNTNGVTLDSDGDKVPDYKDKEPYSPPGYAVNADGVAQVPKAITEADVNRIVDAKIAAIKIPEPKTDWFLPNVSFSDNSYTVRSSETEKLHYVATVLKNNPNIKVVVVGHTDARGPEGYNNVLSYNRAKAAIEALVSQHGVSRDRLILNWAGEGNKLVSSNAANSMNRRAEFHVAKGETEMARPEGKEAGKGSFKGNKDAGY